MFNVIDRVVERGPGRFFVQAFGEDHGTCRSIAEFASSQEGHVRKAKLEQILRLCGESGADQPIGALEKSPRRDRGLVGGKPSIQNGLRRYSMQ
jgi:hypothetical protein